ncbi:MAG: SCP2 sterol-binding domain-containing protein [Pseudomonadota bacterium]
MIPQILFNGLTTAINHVLADEPWARARLAAHVGKVACFDAGVVNIKLTVTADSLLQALAYATASEAVPDVTIKAKLADLPLIAQNPARAFSYVKVEGDADFANTISQLSQGLRWDAEADLSKVVGDIAAVRLVAGAKSLVQNARVTHQKISENVAEFLLEEQPMLVRPEMVDDFGNAVAKTRDDVERLQKRLEKLDLLFAKNAAVSNGQA